ncbi:MAG: hypothetical protein JWP96_1834 [Polaromonas sp.]|nr:hypothetical protein [Polaromonas sp.]
MLAGRNYHCQCGQPVFFRNSQCLACQTPLGYVPERGRLLPLMPGPQPDTWQEWQPPAMSDAGVDTDANRAGQEEAPVYKRCPNVSNSARCNWLVAFDDPINLCRACRLNHTIPDLANPAQPDNGYLWGLIELAKRRLVSSLILLGLPVASRMHEDPQRGLMFDFLRSSVNGPHVMTGHDTGLITLNLDEADDAKREAVRKAMREPYRTLLGHFRHEVGHYYWDRLVAGTHWMDGFHQLFGDETTSYAESLKRNYENGPPSDWPLHFVSAYASMHPWEDWAECWAHYLHMRDGIDTALSLGLGLDRSDLEVTPFTLDELYQPDHPQAEQFLAFLNHWTRLTTMLNEMSRSMGLADFYPFVLPRQVVAKLHFIHLVVISRSWQEEKNQGEDEALEQHKDQLQSEGESEDEGEENDMEQMPTPSPLSSAPPA